MQGGHNKAYLCCCCVDIDECSAGTATCPANSTVCSNTIGSYTCPCAAGYEASGNNCLGMYEAITEVRNYIVTSYY